ncbi:MAG TPA: 30S ribosomal protein S5 [Candidatus Saccharimonas sp.]|jgi:small subunit ribosomal protein S5|nr:30S ribosomal protein S5 [Candidatus Saccharibacteria bacterium]HPQ82220.1 30S ribosomal protein S5 [Candidatus Saccharimonas sp.]
MADQPAAPAATAHATPQGQRGGSRGGNQRGGRRDDRRNQAPEAPKEFEEVVINIDRVARVVKGGRRFRFKALVVVGNRKNKVGVGVAKGADVQAAIAKATDVAKKHLITVPVVNETIPHEAEVKLSGARVLIKPGAPGTGIIAGGVVRSVISVTGIRNMLSKSLGSTNKVNIAYATIEALRSQVPRDEWLTTEKSDKKAPSKTTDKPAEKPAAKKEAK